MVRSSLSSNGVLALSARNAVVARWILSSPRGKLAASRLVSSAASAAGAGSKPRPAAPVIDPGGAVERMPGGVIRSTDAELSNHGAFLLPVPPAPARQ